MNNYINAPDIITGKDLDYLSDMFNWNYNALKVANNMNENVTNEEIKTIITKAYNLFKNNVIEVLNILKEKETNE